MNTIDNTDTHLSEQQFLLRKNRGTVIAIVILRQIIEKAKEHHIPLPFDFVDFKVAFYTIWTWTLWKMLIYIGGITSLIEAMCDNVDCAVVING